MIGAQSAPAMQGDNSPVLVTVAMPIYNAGPHLRLAVESVVEQTFRRWELLIIDDGSTDDALETIADIHDSRIRIIRDGFNRGLAVRLNEACDLASSPYFARMDQDDVSFPERFERQVQALREDAGVDLVATRAITIDEKNRLTGMFPAALAHEQICAHPWRGFVFPHPTWMGRLEWFRRHRYPDPAPYLCEDQELLLRTYRQSRFITLDEVLFAYRIRTLPNWHRLARTRKAVLAMQSRFFRASDMRWQLLLAGAAYFAKSGTDMARRFGALRSRSDPVDDGVAARWRLTLDRLQPDQR